MFPYYPAGTRPQKADAGIAKNYLNEDELGALNLIISMYLDFAELQALNRRPMYMKGWIAKLDDFLRLSERDILTHASKISHDAAQARAGSEYEKYRALEAAQASRGEKDFEAAIEQVKTNREREAAEEETSKRMKLQFDPQQEYQIAAVDAVVDLFDGQPLNKGDYEIRFESADPGMFSSQVQPELGIGSDSERTLAVILERESHPKIVGFRYFV